MGCSELDSGEVAAAEAVTAPQLSDDRRRLVMTVMLTDDSVNGADTVQIAFDVGGLRCSNGDEVEPTSVGAGTPVSFRRVGDDADMMDPPIIAAEDVVIDCS